MSNRVVRLSCSCIDQLLAIQHHEEETGVDACDQKLAVLFFEDISLPIVEDYDGFQEPPYPYGIYLYEMPEGLELVLARDGETVTFKVEVQE